MLQLFQTEWCPASRRVRQRLTELGIDSLSMMQIVGEMETELGILIPDEDLVELVTVGDLVDKIGARVPGGSA